MTKHRISLFLSPNQTRQLVLVSVGGLLLLLTGCQSLTGNSQPRGTGWANDDPFLGAARPAPPPSGMRLGSLTGQTSPPPIPGVGSTGSNAALVTGGRNDLRIPDRSAPPSYNGYPNPTTPAQGGILLRTPQPLESPGVGPTSSRQPIQPTGYVPTGANAGALLPSLPASGLPGGTFTPTNPAVGMQPPRPPITTNVGLTNARPDMLGMGGIPVKQPTFEELNSRLRALGMVGYHLTRNEQNECVMQSFFIHPSNPQMQRRFEVKGRDEVSVLQSLLEKLEGRTP